MMRSFEKATRQLLIVALRISNTNGIRKLKWNRNVYEASRRLHLYCQIILCTLLRTTGYA